MFLLVALMAVTAPSSLDLTMAYKMCVEDFAIQQIRSGEAADVLVTAGEANCTSEFALVQAAVYQETWSDPATKRALRTLPRTDVARVAQDSIDRQLLDTRAQIHSAVLRNVVFVKTRLNVNDDR